MFSCKILQETLDGILHSFLKGNFCNGYLGWFCFICKVFLPSDKNTAETLTQNCLSPIMIKQAPCFQGLLTQPD